MSVKQALSEALGGVQGTNQPRGLHNFIQEIRLCSNATQEQQRVDKELANIRNKFSASSGLSSYNRKKYVWKLVYMFMLGYEIDFGHMEMISLISSTRYSEKNVGYIAVSLLLRSGDHMMTLVINSIRNDLNSHSSPAQTLALASVANLGGNDLYEALLPEVERLLVVKGTDPFVRKKAALCFLRFFRENPGNLVHSEWVEKMARLLENKNLGVVTSVMSLLMGLASKSPSNYEGLVPLIIHLLTRLVLHKACATEYLYYGTPSPWLHVKLLKFLQLFPPPTDGSQRDKLDKALERIITKTEVSMSVNKSNADHCILFEAVNVIIHHGRESNEDLRSKAMLLLGRFIAVKEPNIRYLGLEVMSRLARLEGNDTAKKHQSTVLMSLKDADISIRRRALDLLFVMADESNGAEIVEELVTYLATSDAAIREEMVLKVAILAEKFTDDLNWYVDKMLEMIAVAGDFVAGAVWHRIIQIVTNHKDLQAYAAERLFLSLESPRAHETAVSVGGYILGEFGYFIAEQASMSGQDQFRVLHQHFFEVGPSAKALLLSTYAKLANLYPECRELVTPVFERFSSSQNLELQQRACEYLGLSDTGEDIVEEVLKEMPAFPENRESAPEARLRRRLEEQEKGAEEKLRAGATNNAGTVGEDDEGGDVGQNGDDGDAKGQGYRGASKGRRKAENSEAAVDGGDDDSLGRELVVRDTQNQVEVDDLLGIGGDDQQQQLQQQYPVQPVQAQGDGYDYSGAIVPAGGSADGYGTYYPNQAQQGYQDNSDSLVALGGGAGSGALDNPVDNYQNNSYPYSNNNPYQNNATTNDAVSYPGQGSALVPAPAGELVSFGEGAPHAPPPGNSGAGDLMYGGATSVVPGPAMASAGDSLLPYDGGMTTNNGSNVGSSNLGALGYQASSAAAPGNPYTGAEATNGMGDVGGVYGDAGTGVGGVGGGMGAVGIPASMEAQVAAWFNALVVAPKGILFEGGPIKIGIIHEYRASQGKLTMYYYNLAGSPLVDFRVDIPTVPYLRSQLGEGPMGLDVEARANQVFMCECLQPFSESPNMAVSFSLEGRLHSFVLRLPVAACSFMDPLQLEATDFSRRWDMLGNASNEEACEVRATSPVTGERWAEIRGMIVSGMKMGVTDGVPGSEMGSPTLHAAGTFRTGSTTPEGKKISLGAMLRLEIEPSSGTFRIKFRAVHGTVAAALLEVLATQLGGVATGRDSVEIGRGIGGFGA